MRKERILFMKKIWYTLSIILTGIFCIYTLYEGGLSVFSETSQIEEIPPYSLVELGNDDEIIQEFVPLNEYISGINILMINNGEETKGDLTISLKDDQGKVLMNKNVGLGYFTPGQYSPISVNCDLDLKNNRKYYFRFTTDGSEADVVYMLSVSEGEDIDCNGQLSYNKEIVESQGLVLGYTFGEWKYAGYKVQTAGDIQVVIAKIIMAIIVAISLIIILKFFSIKDLKCFIYNYGILRQVAVIGNIVFLFLIAAMYYSVVHGKRIPIISVFIVLLILLLDIWVGRLYRNSVNLQADNQNKRIIFDKYFGLVLFWTVFLRIPMMDNLPKWDASVYYSGIYWACQNFDFSLASIMDAFRIAEHPTIMYTFFSAIGEFLFPGKTYGVLLVDLVLTVAALWCVYKLLQTYWTNFSKCEAMAITLLLSTIPVFLGTFSYINVDYTLIIFFLFLVYAEYRKQYILMLFWTLALIQNKETGWVIVCGYYFIYALMSIRQAVKNRQNKDKISIVKLPVVWIGIICICVIGVYVIRQGSLFQWLNVGTSRGWHATAEEIAQEGLSVAAVGVYPKYILFKLAQIFVMNFNWIASLIIIATLVGVMVDTNRIRDFGVHNMQTTCFGMLAFVVFSIFYITFALNRYNVYSSVILWSIAGICIFDYWKKIISSKMAYLITGMLTLLLLIQTVYYIDPLSNLFFRNLDSGKGVILASNMEGSNYGDTLVNNYRYSYIDSLFDKLLNEIEFDENKEIILLPSGIDNSNMAMTASGWEIGWNKGKGKRQLVSPENDNAESMNLIYYDDIVQGNKSVNSEAVIYFLTYYGFDEESYINKLEKDYDVSERMVISNWGGTLSYYLISPKNYRE